MGYLVYLGVPPSLVLQLQNMVLQTVILKALLVHHYAMVAHHRKLAGLSPGEQYRQHLKAGGYRP